MMLQIHLLENPTLDLVLQAIVNRRIVHEQLSIQQTVRHVHVHFVILRGNNVQIL